MAAVPELTGELKKLVFIPCSDAACSNEIIAEKYEVMFNPSSIAVKLQVDRDGNQADGATSAPMTFKRIKPQDYSFEFVIDGTGADGRAKKDVPEDVSKFLKTVYHLNGEEHQPRYLKILYGAVLLKCVLKSVDVNYNLFSPGGKPLRAKITAGFISCLDQDLSEMINNRSSPDMTHLRKTTASDKLIRMSNKIYKNNLLYVEVAKANKLNSFRHLPDGTEIFFPPIAKTK